MAVPAETFLMDAQKGDLDALTSALEEGVNVNALDAYGNTALMFAAAAGQVKAAEFLIEKGADKAVRNKWGLGPRDWCQWSSRADDMRRIIY